MTSRTMAGRGAGSRCVCDRRAGARPTPTGRSGSWCRSRPATRPISRRARSPSRSSKRLGQPVVVDNRPGAAGTIGADRSRRRSPTATPCSARRRRSASRRRSTGSSPTTPSATSLPVAPIGWTVMMLVATSSFPANNVQELVAVLKADPGKYSYAHLGAGALSQMVMELLKQMAGVDVVGVPYKGSGQALTDLMGGQLPLMFDGLTSANPQVKAGRIKALAVSSKQRIRFAPDVPALAESGVPALKDYDVQAWTGVFAPAGTPKADRRPPERRDRAGRPEPRGQGAARRAEPRSLPADDAERVRRVHEGGVRPVAEGRARGEDRGVAVAAPGAPPRPLTSAAARSRSGCPGRGRSRTRAASTPRWRAR